MPIGRAMGRLLGSTRGGGPAMSLPMLIPGLSTDVSLTIQVRVAVRPTAALQGYQEAQALLHWEAASIPCTHLRPTTDHLMACARSSSGH